jgi:hypothetical protein
VVAIALIIIFPAIATAFPEYLQKVARETPVEQIEDKVRLEDYSDDPYSRQSREAGEDRLEDADSLEKPDEAPAEQPK